MVFNIQDFILENFRTTKNAGLVSDFLRNTTIPDRDQYDFFDGFSARGSNQLKRYRSTIYEVSLLHYANWAHTITQSLSKKLRVDSKVYLEDRQGIHHFANDHRQVLEFGEQFLSKYTDAKISFKASIKGQSRDILEYMDENNQCQKIIRARFFIHNWILGNGLESTRTDLRALAGFFSYSVERKNSDEFTDAERINTLIDILAECVQGPDESMELVCTDGIMERVKAAGYAIKISKCSESQDQNLLGEIIEMSKAYANSRLQSNGDPDLTLQHVAFYALEKTARELEGGGKYREILVEKLQSWANIIASYQVITILKEYYENKVFIHAFIENMLLVLEEAGIDEEDARFFLWSANIQSKDIDSQAYENNGPELLAYKWGHILTLASIYFTVDNRISKKYIVEKVQENWVKPINLKVDAFLQKTDSEISSSIQVLVLEKVRFMLPPINHVDQAMKWAGLIKRGIIFWSSIYTEKSAEKIAQILSKEDTYVYKDGCENTLLITAIKNKWENLAIKIIKDMSGRVELEKQVKEDYLIHLAIRYNCLKVTRVLIEKVNQEVLSIRDPQNSNTILHELGGLYLENSIEKKEDIEELSLKIMEKIDRKTIAHQNNYGETALHVFCYSKKPSAHPCRKTLFTLLNHMEEKDLGLGCMDSGELTLYYDDEVINPPDTYNVNALTALHLAIYSEMPNDFIKALIDKMGVDNVCKANGYGHNALHFAACQCNVEIVKYLLDNTLISDKLFDQKDICGNNPLFATLVRSNAFHDLTVDSEYNEFRHCAESVDQKIANLTEVVGVLQAYGYQEEDSYHYLIKEPIDHTGYKYYQVNIFMTCMRYARDGEIIHDIASKLPSPIFIEQLVGFMSFVRNELDLDEDRPGGQDGQLETMESTCPFFFTRLKDVVREKFELINDRPSFSIHDDFSKVIKVIDAMKVVDHVYGVHELMQSLIIDYIQEKNIDEFTIDTLNLFLKKEKDVYEDIKKLHFFYDDHNIPEEILSVIDKVLQEKFRLKNGGKKTEASLIEVIELLEQWNMGVVVVDKIVSNCIVDFIKSRNIKSSIDQVVKYMPYENIAYFLNKLFYCTNRGFLKKGVFRKKYAYSKDSKPVWDLAEKIVSVRFLLDESINQSECKDRLRTLVQLLPQKGWYFPDGWLLSIAYQYMLKHGIDSSDIREYKEKYTLSDQSIKFLEALTDIYLRGLLKTANLQIKKNANQESKSYNKRLLELHGIWESDSNKCMKVMNANGSFNPNRF